MSFPALMKNIGAQCIVGGHGGDDVIADATFVSGAACDLRALGNPQSCIAVAHAAFTCSAWTDGTQVFNWVVETDDNSSFTSATELATESTTYTTTGTGLNFGMHTACVDLTAAERYVRVKAKLTKANTATYNNAISVGILFGGLDVTPDPSYAADMESKTVV